MSHSPRTYTKSRTGCKTCRRRKVKCDETSPLCRNCIRRGVECEWGDPPVPSHPRSGLSSFPALMASTDLDLQGIELIHQWTTSTCYTVCSEPFARDVWQLTIPRVAVQPNNLFLLHALLAVSALHLFTLNPSHTFSIQYSCAAVAHYNQAVAALPARTEDGTIFAAQLLIGMYGFATSPSVPVESDWLRILRKAAPTFNDPSGVLQFTVVSGLIPWLSGLHSEPSSLCRGLTTLPLPLSGVPEMDEVLNVDNSAAYQHGLRTFEKSLAASMYPDFHLYAALSWFMLSSDKFMESLLQRHPRALVLLAHYCAMMKRMNGPWWTQKEWGFELERISSVLGDRWDRWVDWPTLLHV